MKHHLLLLVAISLLGACQTTTPVANNALSAASKADNGASTEKLAAALAAQPDASQQRYSYRHPQQTLEFFGIKPGQTVVEGLPGGGWYTTILLDYLGADGHLIGADYEISMFDKFGFFSADFIDSKKTWAKDWVEEMQAKRNEHSAMLSAFVFGSMPKSLHGSADAVLMIRALHNLNRFETDGAYRTRALRDIYNVLKPGGVVGIVQHQAPDQMPDEWADGSKGYLKKDATIAFMESAGFKLAAESGINHNHRDKPGADDVVWRLPPTLATSREDPALREQMLAIGESNRMTLKFVKPR